MDNIQPVFILGNPRSGTSLFRIMLNAHPEIVAPPECGFAQWWLPKYSNWTEEDLKSDRLYRFLEDLFDSTKIETWLLKKENVKNLIISKKPQTYGDLVSCVYLSYGKSQEEIKIICDKNNYYINYLDELPKIWPQAKFIHLIRDGRDVACSYKDLQNLDTKSKYRPNLPTSIEVIAEEWVNNNNVIHNLNNKYPNRYFILKFEDLILNPTQILQDVCGFLDLKFSDQMLIYYKSQDNNKLEPEETMDWKRKTREKPDVHRVNRYKNVLSREEIKIFNSIASANLKFYGYDS